MKDALCHSDYKYPKNGGLSQRDGTTPELRRPGDKEDGERRAKAQHGARATRTVIVDDGPTTTKRAPREQRRLIEGQRRPWAR